MKNTNSRRWLSGSDANLRSNVTAVLLALWVVLSIGCGRFNDYLAAPTIVDASEQPPYVTSPVETPPTSPTSISPLPRQSVNSPDSSANDFSGESLTVTAAPLVGRQQPSASPVDSAPHANQASHRRVLYEYAPNHPAADEYGYIKIINPAYNDPSTTLPVQPAQLSDPVEVPSEPAAISSPPDGDLPRVTEVTITGTAPPQTLESPESMAPKPPRQTDSDSATLVSQPPLSVKGLHLESVHSQEKQVVPTVQELSSQELTASKSMSLPVPLNTSTATIEELLQLIRENPDDTQKQVLLRFLYLTYNQKEKALELFPSVPSEKQAEAISIVRAAMLTAKASDKAQGVGQADTANRALEALSRLSEMVAEQADLEVAHLEICQDQSVKGFGQYEPLAKNLLTTGEPRTVQIYCELKHFKSQLNPDGKYITRVAAAIELVDEDYRTIYQLPKSEIPDVPSYHPRRDFFFRGQVRLPRLAPGKYEFVVRVEDKFAGKMARPFRKPFEVKAPARKRP